MNIKEIDVNLITANKNQPRKYFDEKKLEELCASIKEYGIIQPIIVKQLTDTYEIIAGERRYRAAKLAGLTTVPTIINDDNRYLNDSVSVIENVQRENLSAVEEANAYVALMHDYSLTQFEVSKIVGKRPSTISNKIRLLKLDDKVIESISHGLITERHGRALLSVDKAKQVKYLDEIVEKGLTVKQLETKLSNPAKHKQVKKASMITSKDYKLAINTLKDAMKLINKTGMHTSYAEELVDRNLVVTIKLSKED